MKTIDEGGISEVERRVWNSESEELCLGRLGVGEREGGVIVPREEGDREGWCEVE